MSAPGPTDRPSQRALLVRAAGARPGSVVYDEGSSTLLDVFSGKPLRLDWTQVQAVEERIDATTGRPYAVVRLDPGLEIAIADAGIAFAPVTAATGPLGGLPAAVCFRDLAGAEERLAHFLGAHPGEPPQREHVALLLFCLAVVDGARAVGFDVSADERRLERLLGEMEARRRG